jgi:SseB protein N-terminal domain
MGVAGRVDQATIAFRRVLAEANAGEQARVDALVVLSQRTVYAATWPGQNQAARTLTNSEGESALPLFTGMDVLDTTATRFGWRNADGSLQFRELGAREALRHALARGVHFVVVDIGCEHSVEFAREELEPLLQLQSQRNGTGPYAATGERQAAILDAVRRSSSKPPRSSALPANSQGVLPVNDAPFPEHHTGRDVRQTRPSPPMAAAAARKRPASQPMLPAVSVPTAADARSNTGAVRDARMNLDVSREARLNAEAARFNAESPSSSLGRPATGSHGQPPESLEFGKVARHDPNKPEPRDDEPTVAERSASDKALAPPKQALADELLRGIAGGLRAFPEVEWACVLSDGSDIPLIALRVDPSFLNRVADITDAILGVGDKHATVLQVMLLNNQDLVKNARRHGKAFYPWRR